MCRHLNTGAGALPIQNEIMPFSTHEVPTKYPTTREPLGHAGICEDFGAVHGQVAGIGQSEEHGLFGHHDREIRPSKDAPRMMLEHCNREK